MIDERPEEGDEGAAGDDAPETPTGGDAPETPTGAPETGESGGFGLTEEFNRIEAEIEEEIGRGRAAEKPEPEPAEPGPAEPEAEKPAEPEPVEPEAPEAAQEQAGEPEAEEPDAEAEPPAAEPESVEQPTEVAEPVPEPTATEHPLITPMPRPTPIAVASAIPEDELEEKTPRLWLSFLVGSILIILAMASATTAIGFLKLDLLVDKLKSNKIVVDERDIEAVAGGDPQTLLLIGSDKRSSAPEAGARSDTTMLVRIDPDKDLISMFSLPRDLVVEIPGYGTGKLNEAFSVGNAKLTLKTVKKLTGLPINHLAKIDFEGFGEAVNALGCVYVDVDRDYFSDGSQGYAQIDLNPGYQRLCGQDALDYVRFRHTDTDIVRSARQQDFLREARSQVPVGEIATSLGDHELVNIMIEHIESDIDSGAELVGLLKSFLGARDAEVNEVHFEGDIGDATNTDVTATDAQIEAAVAQFLGNEPSEGTRGGEGALQPKEDEKKNKGKEEKKDGKPDEPDEPDESDVSVIAGDPGFARFATTVERRQPGLSGFYPSVMDEFSSYNPESREYEICVEGPVEGECKETESAYKLVVTLARSTALPEYYGVMGTSWDDPPILENPSERRVIDDREYLLFYDGGRLRLVGFRFEGNSYWVSNTLTQSVSEADMLEIATTMKQSHYKPRNKR